MWITEENVTNTAVLGNSEPHFNSRFLRELKMKRSAVSEEFLESLESEIRNDCLNEPNRTTIIRNESLKGKLLPEEYKIGDGIGSYNHGIRPLIRKAVADLPLEWRLDSIVLIEDVIEN